MEGGLSGTCTQSLRTLVCVVMGRQSNTDCSSSIFTEKGEYFLKCESAIKVLPGLSHGSFLFILYQAETEQICGPDLGRTSCVPGCCPCTSGIGNVLSSRTPRHIQEKLKNKKFETADWSSGESDP